MTMQPPDGGGARSYVSSDCTRLPGVSTPAQPHTSSHQSLTTRPGPRNLEQQTDHPPFSVLCRGTLTYPSLYFIL